MRYCVHAFYRGIFRRKNIIRFVRFQRRDPERNGFHVDPKTVELDAKLIESGKPITCVRHAKGFVGYLTVSKWHVKYRR